MAYKLYSSNNNNRTIGKFPLYPKKTTMWMGSIYPYHESPTLMKCPSVTHLSLDVSVENSWGSDKTGWAGDSGWWKLGEHKGRGSYALNAWTWSEDKDGVKTSDNHFHHLAEVDIPSNTPLFFDSSWVDAQPSRNQDPSSSNGSQTNGIGRIYLDRHLGKKVNYAMMDGSAKTIKINKLYHLDWTNGFLYRDLPLF